MRLEIESGPFGTTFVVSLGEDESRSLNSGLETEARAWRQTLRQRIRDAGILDGVRQLMANLEGSKVELQEAQAAREALIRERRKLLEEGGNAGGCEKKLKALEQDARIIVGRIEDLEQIVRAKIAEAGALVNEEQLNVMTELYRIQEKERAELQAAFFEAAEDTIRKLVRLHKLAASRGADLQRWRRRVENGESGNIVQEMLAGQDVALETLAAQKVKPAAAAEPVAAVTT
jgi:hypothetical protein